MNQHNLPLYFNIFDGWGGRPTTPPPVTSHSINLSVFGVEAGKVIKVRLDDDSGNIYFGERDPNFPQIGRFKVLFKTPPSTLTHGATVHVESEGFVPTDFRIILQAGENEVPAVTLEPQGARAEGRCGLVRLVGHSWQDDGGIFFPLGTTFFWALGGWHRGEQERVKANLRLISEQGFDYVRILGQVDWRGEEINPRWPDYPQTLASFIDTAYDEFGLRTQLTGFGGTDTDPVGAARIMLDVILPRREKVIMLEAVNEGNMGDTTAISIAKVFSGAGLPFGVGLGNQGIGDINAASRASGSTVAFYHYERQNGDNGARQVRQCWNFKEFEKAPVNNEPPGPASSSTEYKDPFKLAAMRAGSIICGAGAFCFHTGAGVFGRRHITTNGYLREANLVEVPNLIPMMKAVKAAHAHLPAGIENWTKFNTGHPVKIQSGPVNKLYGAKDGKRFAEIVIGAEAPTIALKAEVDCSVQISNPATGDVLNKHVMKKGDTVQVSGLWAYIIVGTFL